MVLSHASLTQFPPRALEHVTPMLHRFWNHLGHRRPVLPVKNTRTHIEEKPPACKEFEREEYVVSKTVPPKAESGRPSLRSLESAP